MKLIECPRDAMQGLEEFIPTAKKIAYLNRLLQVGFDILDCGSFVSPRAIPQMKDTANVLQSLEHQIHGAGSSNTKLSVIVANVRGAQDAAAFEQIDLLGFPFSISETFQQRNTNSSIDESLGRVEEIQETCRKNGKELCIYISMAFGNPYGDHWNEEIAMKWVERLNQEIEVINFSMADTIGVSTPENIQRIFGGLIPEFPKLRFSAHLHTTADSWEEKAKAVIESGCDCFEGAIKGFGGCPMAKDDLVGNMAMENIIAYCDREAIPLGINRKLFGKAMEQALEIFPN